MSIIGCDLHTRYQVIAMLEVEGGEVVGRRLEHENGEAKTFYAGLPKPSLIGIEAMGYASPTSGELSAPDVSPLSLIGTRPATRLSAA